MYLCPNPDLRPNKVRGGEGRGKRGVMGREKQFFSETQCFRGIARPATGNGAAPCKLCYILWVNEPNSYFQVQN